MDLHHQYAAKKTSPVHGFGGSLSWIGMSGEGKLCLVASEDQAITKWNRRLAAGLIEDFVKENWNITMGDKPTFEIVKVKRPMKIHHPW